MCTVAILEVAKEPVWLHLCDTPVPAGFPSPADDERGERIDLNKILLPHPTHTYLARVSGTSMDGPPSHITDGALLAVDCALKPQVGHVVVAAVDDEFTVKRLEKRGATYWLVPDNPAFAPLEIQGRTHVKVWGVVTHVVTELIHGQLHRDVRARRLQ
ncbi:MAG TPA: translesion error-prone DNA polymerase V autoproteolytic subunit [Hymenobacter sp.]|jgi:DNA polymerase V